MHSNRDTHTERSPPLATGFRLGGSAPMKTRLEPTMSRAGIVCRDRHCGQQSAAVTSRYMAQRDAAVRVSPNAHWAGDLRVPELTRSADVKLNKGVKLRVIASLLTLTPSAARAGITSFGKPL